MNTINLCVTLVQYTVTVKTGSAMGSGTDANVFITLNGDKNKIDRHRLGTPESNRNPFEKGSKDDFKFEDTDVGKVSLLAQFVHKKDRAYFSS